MHATIVGAVPTKPKAPVLLTTKPQRTSAAIRWDSVIRHCTSGCQTPPPNCGHEATGGLLSHARPPPSHAGL